MTTNHILTGDAANEVANMPAESIDCVITSPPYYRLRNYGQAGQLGLESTVDAWVESLRAVFEELARVLKLSGSVWLNVGDSYSRTKISGIPPKSLVLAPERLLLALADDGWLVRNKVIWAKTNPMPSSVKDRLATGHEYIYFLTRNPRYYFDLDQIRVPHQSATASATPMRPSTDYIIDSERTPSWVGPLSGNNSGLKRMKDSGQVGHPLGKNPGDVWRLSTASFRGPHFASFPQSLVQRPLLATCPERLCRSCGKPWQRTKIKTLGHLAVQGKLQPQCTCSGAWASGIVLDPFMGSGTVGLVAEAHQRRWIGIELNPDFVKLATDRIESARGKAPGSGEQAAA